MKMMMIKKILKFIENIVLTLIFIISITFIGARAFGIESFVVMSGSMEPTIHTGALVFVDTKAKYDSIGLNDIVVFDANPDTLIDGESSGKSMRVIHRIVQKVENTETNGKEYVTKGDNNESNDSVTVTPNTFIGKELFSIPSLGFAIQFMNKYNIKYAIIIFILLLVVFELVFNFFFKSSDEGVYDDGDNNKDEKEEENNDNDNLIK